MSEFGGRGSWVCPASTCCLSLDEDCYSPPLKKKNNDYFFQPFHLPSRGKRAIRPVGLGFLLLYFYLPEWLLSSDCSPDQLVKCPYLINDCFCLFPDLSSLAFPQKWRVFLFSGIHQASIQCAMVKRIPSSACGNKARLRAGWVPDHCNKVKITMKRVEFFGFPVYIKVLCALYCNPLNVQ